MFYYFFYFYLNINYNKKIEFWYLIVTIIKEYKDRLLNLIRNYHAWI